MGNFQQGIYILIEEPAIVFTAYSSEHLHAALFFFNAALVLHLLH